MAVHHFYISLDDLVRTKYILTRPDGFADAMGLGYRFVFYCVSAPGPNQNRPYLTHVEDCL